MDYTDDQILMINEQIKELEIKLRARIEVVEAQGAQPDILWQPEIGERYFYGNGYGICRGRWDGTDPDKCNYIGQQLFRTLEEIEHLYGALKAKMRVLRRVAELNYEQGFECDWENSKQSKCFVFFNYNQGSIRHENWRFSQAIPTDHIGADGVWEQVVNEMEADVKLGLWGIE